MEDQVQGGASEVAATTAPADTSAEPVQSETSEGTEQVDQNADGQTDEPSGYTPPDEDTVSKMNRDYTRATQELAEAKREAAQLREQVAQTQTAQEQIDDPVREAVNQIMPYLKEEGMMTREEVEALQSREKANNALRGEVERLEKTYDGKDGRPQFKSQDVINFALEASGGSNIAIADLEAAYKLKHEKEILDWHIKQSKKGGVKTERSDGSGAKQAQPNDAEMLSKAKKTGDYSDVLKRKLIAK